ncbi:MAG: FAD-dependent oxidoreductase, partial [Methylocapsa sp.]|nr:FAD-dependent oxidoreductase [Methylocapsa sp.]
MSAELEPDLCVVGGGPGGLTVAFGAAAAGKSVILIEKGALGGRRLSEGLPRQALLAAARAADSVRGAVQFGIEVQALPVNFAHLRQQIATAVAAVAPNYSIARAEAMNVKVIRAVGRFAGPGTCEAGGEIIKARQFVIATGAAPKRLSLPGIDTVRPLDSATLCGLDRLPERLVVLGADPEGLALAQAFRRLGSEVAILTGEKLFPSEDEELVAPVRAAFARDGIAIYENVRIARIEPRGTGARIILGPGGEGVPVVGSHLLVAAGYSPAVEGLGLTAAGVRYGESGIETNMRLVTSNGRIFAIG